MSEQLDERVSRGRVGGIHREGYHLLILGDGIELRARRVLVATGTNRARVPGWSRALRQEGAPVRHVFDGSTGDVEDVLGGGISAVQRALMIERASDRPVRLWMRRPITVTDFDVDRDWTKHRFAHRWSELEGAERLDFLRRHPGRGSVPHGLEKRLVRAVRRGSIELRVGEPTVRWDAGNGGLELRLGRERVGSRGLTLATGLEPERAAGWLGALADQHGLPMVEHMPLLADDMQWGQGIYVSGPLARLRLGPMAGNVIGARWATSKLPGVRMQPV